MSYLRNIARAVFGPPLRAMAGGYEAASTGRRMSSWHATTADINTLLAGSGDTLRARSRELVRRNAWAGAGIDEFVTSAIGTGIVPRSQHPDKKVRQAIQSLWQDWTDEADAHDRTDFYGLQALAWESMMEGGDVLGRFVVQPADVGLSVPLQVQLLEAEHLPLSKNDKTASGNQVYSGIEFEGGRRVAYHLYRQHPGSSVGIAAGAIDRFEARDIVHMFRPRRPGQLRGEPWLTRAMVKLHELDKYDDAELVRKQVAAMLMGFIEKQSPDDKLLPEIWDSADEGVGLAKLESGTIQELLPGEAIKFNEPADVGGSYEPFIRSQLQAVAKAAHNTYEKLTGDYSKVNFSSIRAGLVEFQRLVERLQHAVMVYQFCRPIWRRWIDEAMLAGVLPMVEGPARRDYYRCKWYPQGFPWVDPLKEIQAKLLEINGGLNSRAKAVAERGYDVEEVDAENAADRQREESLGLEYAKGTSPNQQQPEQEGQTA